ncbi:MAG TPA: Rieske 2Fe-2S domain-containing protein [Planctomycetota bacterium]|nr:Rieske 2Fe-2S domain-containing protein [Planctomycetota bacterium]
MPTFVRAATATEIPAGSGRCVDVQGAQVAVFNVGGTFLAIANTCPHRGGPLAEGDLSGTVVTCPWHGFQYDVRTGQSADGKPFQLQTYPVRVTDGAIEIGVA